MKYETGDTVAVNYDGDWYLASITKVGPQGGLFIRFADNSTSKILPSQVSDANVVRLVNAPKLLAAPMTLAKVKSIELKTRPALKAPPAPKAKESKPVPPARPAKRTQDVDDVDFGDFDVTKPVGKPRTVTVTRPVKPTQVKQEEPEYKGPVVLQVPKQPPARRSADGAPHLKIPPLYVQQYARCQADESDPLRLRFIRSLWHHFNETRFGSQLTEPNFKLLNAPSIDSFKTRAYWHPMHRLIAINRRLFGIYQDYFMEIFLHEMCHQAVWDIDTYKLGILIDRSQQGHGKNWQDWMVKVGLNPRRFDPTPNSEYLVGKEKLIQRDAEMDVLNAIRGQVPFQESTVHIGLRVKGVVTRKENGVPVRRIVYGLAAGLIHKDGIPIVVVLCRDFSTANVELRNAYYCSEEEANAHDLYPERLYDTLRPYHRRIKDYYATVDSVTWVDRPFIPALRPPLQFEAKGFEYLESRAAAGIRLAHETASRAFPCLKQVKVDVTRKDLFQGNSETMLATKSRDTVFFNPHFAYSPEFWSDYQKTWDLLHYDATPYGVMMHELGHIAATRLLEKLGAAGFNDLVDETLPGVDWTSITNLVGTPYGQENQSECLAELFSMYLKGVPTHSNEIGHSRLAYAKAFWSRAAEILA